MIPPIPESFLTPVSPAIEDAAKRARDQEIERWREAAAAFVAAGLRQRLPKGAPIQFNNADPELTVTDRAVLGVARVLYQEFLDSTFASVYRKWRFNVRLRVMHDFSGILVEVVE